MFIIVFVVVLIFMVITCLYGGQFHGDQVHGGQVHHLYKGPW